MGRPKGVDSQVGYTDFGQATYKNWAVGLVGHLEREEPDWKGAH